MVKITAPATDSPAEAMVWTMLFSRMLDVFIRLNTIIEIKAAGIEPAMVRAIFSPKKVVEAAKTMARKIPNMITRGVTSGKILDAGTNGSI